MKLKGPIVTLAAGAIFAAVLLVLNSNATRAALESATPPNDSSYGEEDVGRRGSVDGRADDARADGRRRGPGDLRRQRGRWRAHPRDRVKDGKAIATSVTAGAPRPGCRAPGAAAHSP
jgi:hypothetical protein